MLSTMASSVLVRAAAPTKCAVMIQPVLRYTTLRTVGRSRSTTNSQSLLFQHQQQQQHQKSISSTLRKIQQRRMTTTPPSTPPTTSTPPPPSPTSTAATSTATATATTAAKEETKKRGWWHSAELWGTAGAIAGWGMSGSAIYDAFQQGPEVISLPMTSVLIVYSTLFTRWAMIIQPQNLFLAACHATNVVAQSNQLRRGLEYKIENGQQDQVNDMIQKAGIGAAVLLPSVVLGPMIRKFFSNPNLFGTFLASIAAADAGPFTVHFWAPMSKWMISGASFFELHRPTDKISLPQYAVLSLTGFFFTRYALLVIPTNYVLCSVNVALFGSSAWHLGRKINADYLHYGLDETSMK